MYRYVELLVPLSCYLLKCCLHDSEFQREHDKHTLVNFVPKKIFSLITLSLKCLSESQYTIWHHFFIIIIALWAAGNTDTTLCIRVLKASLTSQVCAHTSWLQRKIG